jgi:hypothetical protein
MFKRLISLIPALLTGVLITCAVNTAALASTEEGSKDEWRANPEMMHKHIKARLDKFASRLEIKASQMAAWDAFAKSVEALADRQAKQLDENADAAAVAHFRAERVMDMARKLSAIADATDKLEAVLNKNQRKILDEESMHFHHGFHKHGHHECETHDKHEHGEEYHE